MRSYSVYGIVLHWTSAILAMNPSTQHGVGLWSYLVDEDPIRCAQFDAPLFYYNLIKFQLF